MRKPSSCGTSSGYKRHRRRREEACLPCKDAHRLAQQRGNDIYRIAVRRLIDLHGDDWSQIRAEVAAEYDKEQADAAWAAVFEEVARADQG